MTNSGLRIVVKKLTEDIIVVGRKYDIDRFEQEGFSASVRESVSVTMDSGAKVLACRPPTLDLYNDEENKRKTQCALESMVPPKERYRVAPGRGKKKRR